MRYDVEVVMVRRARAMGMPLLGICRGHQMIAEALGGRVATVDPGSARHEHYQREPPTVPTHGLHLDSNRCTNRDGT